VQTPERSGRTLSQVRAHLEFLVATRKSALFCQLRNRALAYRTQRWCDRARTLRVSCSEARLGSTARRLRACGRESCGRCEDRRRLALVARHRHQDVADILAVELIKREPARQRIVGREVGSFGPRNFCRQVGAFARTSSMRRLVFEVSASWIGVTKSRATLL
jgi:hypothetical protein